MTQQYKYQIKLFHIRLIDTNVPVRSNKCSKLICANVYAKSLVQFNTSSKLEICKHGDMTTSNVQDKQVLL